MAAFALPSGTRELKRALEEELRVEIEVMRSVVDEAGDEFQDDEAAGEVKVWLTQLETLLSELESTSATPDFDA